MNHFLYDMLTRIRNGLLARRPQILQPKFKICVQLLDILEEEGYISGYKTSKISPEMFEVFLKYKSKKPAINKIIIISKPSKRIYISIKEVWKLNTGFGLAILFTPRGIISCRQARRFNVGGEILCILK
jgi:small subunit ribosomal protein S8